MEDVLMARKGFELNFHVNMPPLLLDANHTYDGANTLAQIMHQASLDWGRFTITVSIIALPGFMMGRGFPPGGPGGVFPNFGVGLGGLGGGGPGGVLHDYGVGFGGLGGGGIRHGGVPPGHGCAALGGAPRGRRPPSRSARARAHGGRGNENQ
ncbi:hypothetical protein Tco_0032307 [Tanacetum coccineum]